MRLWPIVVLLSGCSASQVDLDLMSVLDTNARGVAVHDGGHLASVAMSDQICQVDLTTGAVVQDNDPSEKQESLLDAKGTVALALSDNLFELPLDGEVTSPPFQVTAVDARLSGAGLMALYRSKGGCGVALWDGTDATGFTTDVVSCDGAVGLATSADAAWVADGDAVAAIDTAGNVSLYDAQADLVGFDLADNLAIIGLRGGTSLAAIDAGGQAAWEVSLSGGLHALDVAATEGLVVVSLADDHGGRVLVLDGATGLAIAEHVVPEAVGVAFADDGRALALSTDTQVYFYEVDPTASAFDTPSVAQVDGKKGLGGAAALVGTTLAVVAIVD